MKPTKRCSACGQFRPLAAFSIRKASPDKLAYKCRDCEKQYRLGRKEEYRILRRASYLANRQKEKTKSLDYYYRNRSRRLRQHAEYMLRTQDQQRQYQKQTSAEYNARTAAYRAALVERTPLG